jgi:hypothetical protein
MTASSWLLLAGSAQEISAANGAPGLRPPPLRVPALRAASHSVILAQYHRRFSPISLTAPTSAIHSFHSPNRFPCGDPRRSRHRRNSWLFRCRTSAKLVAYEPRPPASTARSMQSVSALKYSVAVTGSPQPSGSKMGTLTSVYTGYVFPYVR